MKSEFVCCFLFYFFCMNPHSFFFKFCWTLSQVFLLALSQALASVQQVFPIEINNTPQDSLGIYTV